MIYFIIPIPIFVFVAWILESYLAGVIAAIISLIMLFFLFDFIRITWHILPKEELEVSKKTLDIEHSEITDIILSDDVGILIYGPICYKYLYNRKICELKLRYNQPENSFIRKTVGYTGFVRKLFGSCEESFHELNLTGKPEDYNLRRFNI